MKIGVTSDLHGNLPVISEVYDLLLICGDICPTREQYRLYQKEYMTDVFAEYIKKLEMGHDWSKVVMVYGNHDFYGEVMTDVEKDAIYHNSGDRLIILMNESYDFKYFNDNGEEKSITIFGTPYCKRFGRWAFMEDNEKLLEIYDKIPEDIDILISHDSPTLNNLGLITEGWQTGVNAGNTVLTDVILQKRPRYFFSGHIHSGNHNFEKLYETMMANVSLLDERYHPTNKILTFNYD